MSNEEVDRVWSKVEEAMRVELEKRIASGDRRAIMDAFQKIVLAMKRTEIELSQAVEANRQWKLWAEAVKAHVLPLLKGELLKRYKEAVAKGFKGTPHEFLKDPLFR